MIGATPPWIPLLRRLTLAEPAWGVWKNADRAVRGEGDIDSVAPRGAKAMLIHEFRRWARASRVGPVIVCEHSPETLVLVGCSGVEPTWLLQLDVYATVANVADASTLSALMETDSEGFRRLRPGAESLLLLLDAARRGGRPPRNGHELERVGRLLLEDPDGAKLAASRLGVVGPAALAGATAVAANGWDRRAMLLLELAYILRALRDPRPRLRWLRFFLTARRTCPLLKTLADGRVVRGELGSWLDEIRQTHRVYDPA
jgi:hypothetical protein